MSSLSKPLLKIDGRIGEGGGQILRTALALSLCTKTPFQIEQIRAKRKKPGLLAQHLTCVRAATQIGNAQVQGDELGSTTLRFEPGELQAGKFEFDIGTAGSTTLVLQAVLPALGLANAPSELLLHGGTHNPAAPTFDFLQHTLAPVLARIGLGLELSLERHGFYPAGGGRIRVKVTPCAGYSPLELVDRSPIRERSAHILLLNLPESLVRRESILLQPALGVEPELQQASGHGQANVVSIRLRSDELCETFTAFGDPRLRVEAITRGLIDLAMEYDRSGAPVGPHLADQLIVFMALAGEGRFRTSFATPHTKTAIEVCRLFLGRAPQLEKAGKTVMLAMG